MSFAGHVYDMIRRNKENRELLNRRRDRAKEARMRNIELNQPDYDTDKITMEDIERIRKETQEWEVQREKRAFRLVWIILGIAMTLVAGVLVVILFIV